MKHIARVFLYNTFGIWLASQMLPFFLVYNNWQAVLFAGAILSILMLVIKPLLSILFIPINLMTFGLLSWVINVIVLYLLTLIEPSIKVIEWTFPGATYAGFVIPELHFSYLIALICATLTLTLITTILQAISE